MAASLLDHMKTSRNPLMQGILKAVATSDELTSQLPFASVMGDSFSYNREKALPTVEFVSPTHAAITESSATFDKVTVPLRMIVSDVDVYEFAARQQNTDGMDATAVQVEKKLKALGRTIGQKVITGAYATGSTVNEALGGTTIASIGPNQDSTRRGPGSIQFVLAGTLMSYRAPGDRTYGTAVNVGVNGTYTLTSDNPSNWIRVTIVAASLPAANAVSEFTISSSSEEYDGLNTLIPTTHGQVISSTGANGDEMSFAALDRAIDEFVKVRDNLFFIGNAKLKAKFMGLQRSLGGTVPADVQLPGIGRPVPAYRGIPFLQNDWITSAEAKGASTTLSSLWLASLSDDGLSMVVGNDPGANVDTDPRSSRFMGVRVRNIGELEQKEAQRTRVSMYVSTKLGSELAVCRVRELVTA